MSTSDSHSGETAEVVIVLPPVDDGYVASGLYELSEALGALDPEAQSYGFLGGEWGYGQDFVNDVFEMWPYFWGDCDCGHEEAEGAWCQKHDHTPDCYHAVLWGRVDAGESSMDIAPQMAKDWGLPYAGCAVHCTCGATKLYEAWAAEHQHDARCSVARPNFAHQASGLEVRWYKYIGRSMDLNREVTEREWTSILAGCIASVHNGGST